MKYPKISEIINSESPCLTVKFDNGSVKKVDLHNLFTNETFSDLNNPVFFKQAKVDAGGYGVIWSDELDLSEAYIWDNGSSLD